MTNAVLTSDRIRLNDLEFSRPQPITVIEGLFGPASQVSRVIGDVKRFKYDHLGLFFLGTTEEIRLVGFAMASDERTGIFSGVLEIGGLQITPATKPRELTRSSIPFEKIDASEWRFKRDYFWISVRFDLREVSQGTRKRRERFIKHVTAVTAIPGAIDQCPRCGGAPINHESTFSQDEFGRVSGSTSLSECVVCGVKLRKTTSGQPWEKIT